MTSTLVVLNSFVALLGYSDLEHPSNERQTTARMNLFTIKYSVPIIILLALRQFISRSISFRLISANRNNVQCFTLYNFIRITRPSSHTSKLRFTSDTTSTFRLIPIVIPIYTNTPLSIQTAHLDAMVVLLLCKGSPASEGLPTLAKMRPEQANPAELRKNNAQAPEDMTALQIFCQYVLKNKNAWFVSLVDTFVYMVRFGMISWLPIYLLEVKHFSKTEMAIAFLFFEWAAIPSTLFAGYLSDKFFKGYRMPPAIIAMCLIFFCVIGYWQSTTLFWTTVFAAIVGCLIYIPQFLASVQTMEIVPSFAVGSAVGLRGFMSYICGASLGTSLFGFMVDRVGWDGGFYVLLTGVVCCVFFCVLTHRGAQKLAKEREELQRAAG